MKDLIPKRGEMTCKALCGVCGEESEVLFGCEDGKARCVSCAIKYEANLVDSTD